MTQPDRSTDPRTVDEEELRRDLPSILFDARRNRQTIVKDGEGVIKIIIGTNGLVIRDGDEEPDPELDQNPWLR